MAQRKVVGSSGEKSSKTLEQLETLNFKVPVEFKKAFKGYAVAQGMTMVDLLREGFELSKSRRSQ